MEKKKVTFRLFVIKNEELTHDSSDMKEVLRTKLDSINANSRLIPVRDDVDCQEKDFLSSFTPATGTNPDSDYVFGVIMRLKPAKGIKALPDNFLQRLELKETDLEDIPEIAGKIVCSYLYHFLIKGKYLITDLPQKMTISGFQRYINKILVNRSYGFTPYLLIKNIKLSELNSVTFSDSFVQQQEQNNKFSLQKMTMKAIRYISPSVKSLRKILDDNMVSAKMTVNFSRPKGMSDEQYSKKLSAILAPVQDLQNVHFSFANGMTLSGANLVFTKKVELSEENGITPLTYITSMKRIIDSIDEEQ